MTMLRQLPMMIRRVSVKRCVFLIGSVVLLSKDPLHFAIPVAFGIFVLAIWKPLSVFVSKTLDDYREQVQREKTSAQDALDLANARLDLAREARKTLEASLETLLQSAHQEAAHILKRMETEIDTMQDHQRRQIELENIVLRQKWKAVMAQELLSAMRDYIQNMPPSNAVHSEVLANNKETIPEVVFRKINNLSFSKM